MAPAIACSATAWAPCVALVTPPRVCHYLGVPRRRPDADPVFELRQHVELLEAPALRELLFEVTSELEPVAYARLVDAAARKVVGEKGRGALRGAGDASLLTDIEALCRTLKRRAHGDPHQIDDLLSRLNTAWIRGEHETYCAGVTAIAEALDGGVDLGHDELYSEVLQTDLYEVGRRFLVSVYLTTEPSGRPAAILSASGTLDVFEATEDQPISAMEEAALEPLPELDAFASAWAELLRGALTKPRLRGSWALARQLREATLRSAGNAGLAELARASRKREDYEAWVRALLASGDAEGAAAAAREGAAAVAESYQQADLHALAARIEIGRKNRGVGDLLAALVTQPSALALRRWLGALPKTERAGAIGALHVVSKDNTVVASIAALRGEWAAVASVLEPREPLGWSGGDHGGQDAIDAAVWALTRGAPSTMIAQLVRPRRHAVPGLDDPGAWIEEDLAREDGLPELSAPTLTELLGELGPPAPTPSEAKALRDAISRAALSRVSAVASSGRRRRYDDAARVVALASVLHADAGDAKAASEVVARARDIAGRKWTLTQAIDRALGAPSKRAR